MTATQVFFYAVVVLFLTGIAYGVGYRFGRKDSWELVQKSAAELLEAALQILEQVDPERAAKLRAQAEKS